jgi:hypothetical protein
MKDTDGEIFRLDRNAFQPWHVRSVALDQENTGRFSIGETSSTDFTKVVDLDFKSGNIKLPKKIGGRMLCEIPYGTAVAISDPRQITPYIVVKFIKLVGAVETLIATGTSAEQETSAVAAAQTISDGMFTFEVDIPNTTFSNDDVIQITLEAWIKRAAGTVKNVSILIPHDPLARDIASVGSSDAQQLNYNGGNALKFYIPFKIEL